MLASEIITILRSYARDTDYENLRFSDRELLECITHAQNELIAEFSENIHIYKTKAQEALTLPAPIARIYTITLDHKPLATAQFARASEMIAPCFTHFGANRYGVLHLHERDAELEITASFYAKSLEKVSQELELGAEYARSLGLSSYCDLLLIETHQASLQKLQFYRQELEREKSHLRARKNRALNPTTTYTQAHA